MKARRIFFGEIRDGRLARLPFLAWTMLLGLMVIGFGLLAGATLAVVQNLIGGNPATSQAILEEVLAGPLVVGLTLIGLVVLFAQYNLVAKRARDIGLPGWPTVLVVFLLTGLAGATLSEMAIGWANAVVGLTLLLIPSDGLRRGSHRS